MGEDEVLAADDWEDNALLSSYALQTRISARGFDWPDAQGVAGKLLEEVRELHEALADDDHGAAHHEIGDILLAAVNLCRFLGFNPNEVLTQANARFENRFAHLERALDAKGLRVESCTLEELDRVWIEIKSSADKELRKGP
ncbi:MAG: hypothetical protein HYV27_09815 [Candidatus Hydrogenedentes bacterium]|nr:hypothetical protein [Candidatus Hydrogenedentota bacterium]